MASLLLSDYAKMAAADNETLKLGVVQAFREDPLMDMMTWTDVGDLVVRWNIAKSFPTPNFRDLGDSYTSSKSDLRPKEDRLYPIGQNIDVDKALTRIQNSPIGDRRTYERQMSLDAMKRTWRYYLINGNPDETGYKGFTGLWYRLVNNHPASQSIDADGLDLTGDLSVAATRIAAIRKLEDLIDQCNEGDCDAILWDRVTHRAYESVFKFSGLLTTTQDHLGRKFKRYGTDGPFLIPMGYHVDETDVSEGTKVIGHDEAEDGSALTDGDGCTSAYGVKFGKDQLTGLQEYALEMTDKGELEDGVTYRDVLDWVIGITAIRPRCISRLYGITAQASGS